jgi:hypothetical protein
MAYALVVVAFTFSAVAGPRDGSRGNSIEKVWKKVVRTVKSLGDGITIPVPAPKP